MLQITFTESAARDLELIYQFIAFDNTTAAKNFKYRLSQLWRTLMEHPRIGRKRDDLRIGYRSITEGDYVIFYRILSEQSVEIVRVVHGKRDLNRINLTE